MVRSGETNDCYIKKLGGSVLGYQWAAKEDSISVKPNLNLKIGQAKEGALLTPDNLNVI